MTRTIAFSRGVKPAPCAGSDLAPINEMQGCGSVLVPGTVAASQGQLASQRRVYLDGVLVRTYPSYRPHSCKPALESKHD
jgi:hypothetical protein